MPSDPTDPVHIAMDALKAALAKTMAEHRPALEATFSTPKPGDFAAAVAMATSGAIEDMLVADGLDTLTACKITGYAYQNCLGIIAGNYEARMAKHRPGMSGHATSPGGPSHQKH